MTKNTATPTSRLFVTNLPRTITPELFRATASKITGLNGPVTEVRLARVGDSKNRRFGYIGFSSVDDAARGLKYLDKSYIGTSKVMVEFAGSVKEMESNEKKATKRSLNSSPSKNPSQAENVPIETDSTVEATGRLYVINLPYGAEEGPIESHFAAIGPVESVQILKGRGIAFVKYVFADHAPQAVRDLDRSILCGRVIRVSHAKEKPAVQSKDNGNEGEEGSGSKVKPQGPEALGQKSYREVKRQKLAVEDSGRVQSWNLLLVSGLAVGSRGAKDSDGSKASISGFYGLDPAQTQDSSDAAIRQAYVESRIISETKSWLATLGATEDDFTAKGKALLGANLDATERSEDTIIVKHLPGIESSQHSEEAVQLRKMFSRHGHLHTFTIAPSGTLAVVKFTDRACAKAAYEGEAFRRFNTSPLVLEWAPASVLSTSTPVSDSLRYEGAVGSEKVSEESSSISKTVSPTSAVSDSSTVSAILYLSNLSFTVTKEEIEAALVSILSRSSDANDATVRVTVRRGFGFAEFSSEDAASVVLAVLKAECVNIGDKRLIAEFSKAKSSSINPAAKPKEGESLESSSKTNPDHIFVIKNLAFEATKPELFKLVSAYGSVGRIRLPLKTSLTADGRKQHRGFAFVKMASRSDLVKAMKGLAGVHLYGRRLVLEETKTGDDEQALMATALERASLRQIVMDDDRTNVNKVSVKSGKTSGSSGKSSGGSRDIQLGPSFHE